MRICCLGVLGSERNLSYLLDRAVSATDEGWLQMDNFSDRMAAFVESGLSLVRDSSDRNTINASHVV
jgi:hypothetical protein